MKTDNKQKQIEDFVLRHYQHGKLDTQQALHNVRERLQLEEGPSQKARTVPLRHRLRHVAAAIVLVLVMVSAYAIYHNSARQQPAATEQATSHQHAEPSVPKTFHFDNTPIKQVLAELGAYYNIQFSASDTTKHLTGDFEAESPEVLVGMIEQTLGVQIMKSNNEQIVK